MVIYADLPPSEFAFPGPLRDRLVAAILSGRKTSTTSLAIEYDAGGERLPQAGDRGVLVDSAAAPLAILEVTGVRLMPLREVDLAHAVDEGEGHESVAEWRAGHERFWHSAAMRDFLGRPDFVVTDETVVVAERFRVVSLIPGAAEVSAAFSAEAAALSAAIHAAPPADLEKPTCCPPWTVREEFAHTVEAVSRTLEMLGQPAPTGLPVATARYFVADRRFEPAVDTVRVDRARQLAAARPAGALIDWFDREWQAVASAVDSVPGDRLVTTRHGDPMRLTDFQVTRVFELAVHGLDLADGLGVPPWLTPEAAAVVDGLLLGLDAPKARQALGTDSAGLIRYATGRTPLAAADREQLDRLGISWLTLAPQDPGGAGTAG
jgi:uncharacterized protein (TIGR03083 family)